jgi:hypothetical protein
MTIVFGDVEAEKKERAESGSLSPLSFCNADG